MSIANSALRALSSLLRQGLFAVNRMRHSVDEESWPPEIQLESFDSERRSITGFLEALDVQDVIAKEYLANHLQRLVDTLLLVRRSNGGGRALEIGSYLQLAPALAHLKGYSQVHATYLGNGPSERRCVTASGWPDFHCTIDLFDAQRDTFPYPTCYFDLVLAAEVIEHLDRDPMHMLVEVHRVMRDDGCLVLTTPNCASTRSLSNILWGTTNPYVFSSFQRPRAGAVEPGARHAREYTPDELRSMFLSAGFEAPGILTRTSHTGPERARIIDLLENYGYPTQLRGEQIYCWAAKAKATPTQTNRYPSFLYE